MDKGGVVVPCCISGDGYLFVVGGGFLRESGRDIRIALWAVFATSACGEDHPVAFHLDVHRRITQGKEAASGSYAWEARSLAVLDPLEEGLHTPIQAKVHLVQQFAV